jgi:hypothetical protein
VFLIILQVHNILYLHLHFNVLYIKFLIFFLYTNKKKFQCDKFIHNMLNLILIKETLEKKKLTFSLIFLILHKIFYFYSLWGVYRVGTFSFCSGMRVFGVYRVGTFSFCSGMRALSTLKNRTGKVRLYWINTKYGRKSFTLSFVHITYEIFCSRLQTFTLYPPNIIHKIYNTIVYNNLFCTVKDCASTYSFFFFFFFLSTNNIIIYMYREGCILYQQTWYYYITLCFAFYK